MSSTIVQPVAVNVVPQLIQFKAPKRHFILLNSRKREIETLFWGTKLVIPPVHVVDPYGHSAFDADGDAIPGSYLVEDIYTLIPETGEEILTFDATRAVIHILGLTPGPDGYANQATSPHATRGLSLLPSRPTKDVWKAMAEGGADRAFLADVQTAFNYMDEIEQKNLKRKDAGLAPVTPAGFEYERHRRMIEQYQGLVKSQVADELAPHEEDALMEEIELETITKALAQGLVDKVAEGRDIDKMQLFEQLMSDPKVRKLAEKKWKIRKRGSNPVSDAELEKAIESGQKLEE
jgi:hypothetical protein